MMSERKPAAGSGSGRRRWFDLHSWIGLKLCLLLGFICLTGTLAVFAAEIDWLLHASMRVQPEPQRASWGQQLAAVQKAYPEWTLEGLHAPLASRFAARAQMKTPQGRYRHVWIDPYRGEVIGDTHWFNAHRLLRNTHRHLMLPVKYGVPLVAALALPLLLSLVSSFFIYKRWWRGFFTWPRGDRPRRLWGDVHRLAGVWSLAFIGLMGLTGGWYLVESLGGRAPELRAVPVVKDAQGGAEMRAADAVAVDRAMETLARVWPSFEVRSIRPSPDGRVLWLEGQADAWLVRERANVVAFDLVAGRVLGLRDGRELNLHQRISEMADPLHFGNFAGWPVRLLWFLFGGLLTTLCFSGVYLYGLRISDALKAAHRKSGAASPMPGAWRLSWQGMRHWRWPWLALLLLWLLLIPMEIGR